MIENEILNHSNIRIATIDDIYEQKSIKRDYPKYSIESGIGGNLKQNSVTYQWNNIKLYNTRAGGLPEREKRMHV